MQISCLPAAHDPSVSFTQLRLILCWSVTGAQFLYEIQYGISYMAEMERNNAKAMS